MTLLINIIFDVVKHDFPYSIMVSYDQPWSTIINYYQLWLPMFKPWLTIVTFSSWYIVNHSQPWSTDWTNDYDLNSWPLSSLLNHGQLLLVVKFEQPWSTLVNHVHPLSTIGIHGQPWSMVDHVQECLSLIKY